MIDVNIQQAILNELEQLSLPKQRQVLDYAVSLRSDGLSTSGKELLKFAGMITPEDCQLMLEAVEEAPW